MDKPVKEMTLDEFRDFIKPMLISAYENYKNLPENSPMLHIFAKIIATGEREAALSFISRMFGASEVITPQGIYLTMFLLGMECERQGWYLEENIEEG